MAAYLVKNLSGDALLSVLDQKAGLPKLNGCNVPLPKVRII